MKLIFRGWKRQVTVHSHDLEPVEEKQKKFITGKTSTYSASEGSVVSYGKGNSFSLSGDFLVDVTLSNDEIKNYLYAMIEGDPIESIELLHMALAKAQKQALLEA